MTELFCIILAGGSGSRLWPVSRELFPKQMLKINDEYSLFQQTFLNSANLIDDKNIITVSNVKHTSAIKEQLKHLQKKFCRKSEYKVLSEPISKNTAPAISIAIKYIKDTLNYSGQMPVFISVPSDKIITDRNKFSSCIEKGINLAKAGYIVAFGTPANEINENFGYIKARKNSKISEIEPCSLKVSNFIEKPADKEQKEKLKGSFYVNSGIYMFNYETYFSELKKHSPDIYNIIKDKTITSSIPSISLNDYEKFPNISIDYALIEKCKNLVMIPLNTEWKDIGSWEAIYDISKKTEKGNCFTGKTIDIGSVNSMVYSTSKITATAGLKDKLVVETEDAVLVCNRNDTKGIKNIYKKLSGKNSITKEIHKTVYRPWGYYSVLENGNGFLTKCITVNPNAKLSVQLHRHRSEHWIILEGEAVVIKGNETYKLKQGESIDIGIEEIHSLQNFGKEQLKVLEVQQGDILDENDIERIEDIYGRI